MIVPGTEVDGRYRVVRLLGEGSMGAVYEAERAEVGWVHARQRPSPTRCFR